MKQEPEGARAVWARTTLLTWPERLVLVSLPVSAREEAALLAARSPGFTVFLVERDEVSLTVAESAWAGSALQERARSVAGPYRAITLDVDIDLSVVGYLAPAAERLAQAGVSIVPQCGYLKDHLLVREADLKDALRVLETFVAECRG
jgi:hypothetical protein